MSAAQRADRRRWAVLLTMGVGGNLLLVWMYSHDVYATLVAAIAALVAFAYGRATER